MVGKTTRLGKVRPPGAHPAPAPSGLGEDGPSGATEQRWACAWACGQELGNTVPEVKRLGSLPAAAANVRTLEGRADHWAGEGGGGGGVGERGTKRSPCCPLCKRAGGTAAPRPPLSGERQNAERLAAPSAVFLRLSRE